MKRRSTTIAPMLFLMVCLITTVAIGARQSGSTKSSVAGLSAWKTYHDEQNQFELKYPPDWHVSSSSGSAPKMTTISKPGERKLSLTVAVQQSQNPKRLSIEDWFADQLKRMNATPESQGKMTVGKQPAIFMDNTNSFGKRRSIFTRLHEEDVLTLIYEPGSDSDPVYEAILSSFQAR